MNDDRCSERSGPLADNYLNRVRGNPHVVAAIPVGYSVNWVTLTKPKNILANISDYLPVARILQNAIYPVPNGLEFWNRKATRCSCIA
jgi:hypothetical protein